MNTKKSLFRVLFTVLIFIALGMFFQTGQSASPFSQDPLPTIQVTLRPGVDWMTIRNLNVEASTIWQENGQVFAYSSPVINSARDAMLYQELLEDRLNSLPDTQVLTAEVTFKAPLTLAGIESLLGQYTIISLLASGEDGSTGQVSYPPDNVPAELQTEFSQVFEALSGGTPAPSLSPDNYIAATVKASALLLRKLAQKERVYTVDVGPIDLVSDFPNGSFSSLKDVSYDYELHVGSLCEFALLRNRISELSANGQIPASVKDELQGILNNAEAYFTANDVASARNEMALYFETLDENSASIIESAMKETFIVGDCLLVRKMQSDPVVDAGTDQTVQLGSPVTVTATYTDADNTENHSARIDWGDGIVEDVPVTMTGPGAGEVTSEHTYSGIGIYTVEICVTDLYGGVGCDTLNVEAINSFPSTSILDDFNRANGGIGSNWSGNTGKYTINANQLKVISNASNSDVYWSGQAFGAVQEAYFTFSNVYATSKEQNLLLKSQSNTTWGYGVLEVRYDAPNQRVEVWTYEWPAGWIKHGTDIPVTFAVGDQFGARALADGTVEVYKNGTLLATRDITSWLYYDQGGYIGLWFSGAQNTRIDDFGGGTISGGQQSMLAGSTVRSVTADQLNVTVNSVAQFWQGIPLGQTARVTFTSLQDDAKPQSNGVWGEGTFKYCMMFLINSLKCGHITRPQAGFRSETTFPLHSLSAINSMSAPLQRASS